MRRATRLVVLIALCFFTPVRKTAVAQEIDLGVNCTTFAFTACASIVLWTQNNASGFSELFIRMANVQGTPGYTHLIPSGLIGFNLNRVLISPSISNAQFTSILVGGFSTGNVRDQCSTVTGTCAPGPYTGMVANDVDGHNNNDGTATIINDIWSGASGGRVWGCDVPNLGGSDLNSRYSTCGGTTTWRLTLSHFSSDITLTNATNVTIFFRDGALNNASCTTGVDCVTTTPEPATLVLVGTAFVGLAGARARRRKRNAG